MSIETIKVPDIGGAEGVDVIELCVAVGDQVNVEDSLVVLESDKALMEVPSPLAGKVISVSLSEGGTVSEGDVILELEVVAESADTPTPTPVADEPVLAASNEAPAAAQTSLEAPAENNNETITVPDIGGAEGVDVIELCVAVGDTVSEGDSLIVLETDKASMEIPSPYSGEVLAISLAEGDQVAEGDTILQLALAAGVAVVAEKPVASEASAAVKKTSAVTATAPTPPRSTKVTQAVVDKSKSASFYAGPAVRKLARELGVDLDKVAGSGPRGRIIKEDVQSFVKSALASDEKTAGGSGIPAVPAIDFSKFGEVAIEPLSKMHKLTIVNMQRSWLNVPHVTQFDEADISDLEAFRSELKKEAESRGVKLTPLPFLLKICAMALREHPKFNASLHADGEHMVFKNYIHIGMAVDTPAGLVVPVIRDVDKKSLWELGAEIAELGNKAKKRKLMPADMQGACFTISSLGNIGGSGFTPIVNAPEVAILGVSKMAVQPVWDGSEFLPRKMLPLSLSYDHRAVNGADAGRFFTFLISLLSDVRRLIL